MSGRPPPLTEEEKRIRLARIQQDHESFIRGIATMQSLPRLQSTIAGAGGKTNVMARMTQEREAQRMDRLHRGLEANQRDEQAKKETQIKAQQLETVQSKKRKRRAAKKQRQKERAAHGSESDSGSDDNSGSDDDANVPQAESRKEEEEPETAADTKKRRVEGSELSSKKDA